MKEETIRAWKIEELENRWYLKIKRWSYIIILYMRGHSLIGKTATLQVVISGSIPDVSNVKKLSSRSSIGRAGSWSDLGCKFNSYLEHINMYKYIYSTKI